VGLASIKSFTLHNLEAITEESGFSVTYNYLKVYLRGILKEEWAEMHGCCPHVQSNAVTTHLLHRTVIYPMCIKSIVQH